MNQNIQANELIMLCTYQLADGTATHARFQSPPEFRYSVKNVQRERLAIITVECVSVSAHAGDACFHVGTSKRGDIYERDYARL